MTELKAVLVIGVAMLLLGLPLLLGGLWFARRMRRRLLAVQGAKPDLWLFIAPALCIAVLASYQHWRPLLGPDLGMWRPVLIVLLIACLVATLCLSIYAMARFLTWHGDTPEEQPRRDEFLP